MNLKEYAKSIEILEVNGQIIKSKITELKGIVEISHYDGATMFTSHEVKKNDLLVNGSVYFLEKANNIRSSFITSGLDEDLGISQSSQVIRTIETLKGETIIGIVVGIGGCGDNRNTIKAVQSHHKIVPNQVPFRVTTSRLSVEDRAKYLLEKFEGGKYYYWGKKFDFDAVIKVMYTNGVEVPTNVHNIIDPGLIEKYTEYKATVGAKDIREWFLLQDGNTVNSRINTVGLITGYPDIVDGETIYRNVRCITTLNMENKDLKDDLSTVSFVYRHHLE